MARIDISGITFSVFSDGYHAHRPHKGMTDSICISENIIPIAKSLIREDLPPCLISLLGITKEEDGSMDSASNSQKYDYDSENDPIRILGKNYLKMLLEGKRKLAGRLVLDSVENGIAVKDIYLKVFQASQYEIGHLWQSNKITVAQEHFCTAATQMIMSQLYPFIFKTEKIDRTLVASCIGEELHELGIRMVADFFEMEGWDTYYLGANTPTDSILETVDKYKADIVALSATIPFSTERMTNVIKEIRSSAKYSQLKIIVGGRPFNVVADLWKKVNADAFAKNAEEAIKTANLLIN